MKCAPSASPSAPSSREISPRASPPPGRSQTGDREYGGRIGRSVARMERDEKTGMAPEAAGAFLCRVALGGSRRPLYTIGGFYRLAVLLLKLLPARTGNWLLGRLYAT